MKSFIDYAIVNNRHNYIKSFLTKKELFSFVKSHNVGDKIKIDLLFFGPHCATITKNIFLQMRCVSNGAIEILYEKKLKFCTFNFKNKII